MELQELTLRAATIQFRFRLAPRFADLRGRLIEEAVDQYGLTEYGWTDTQLQVFDAPRTNMLIAGSRELRVVCEHLTSVDDFRTTAERFLSQGLQELNLRELNFVGVRTYWMAAVDSFDELCAAMAQHLSAGEPFSEVIGTPLTDVGWVFEYHDENPMHTLRLGPMTVEQLIEQILLNDERDLYPDSFFFMDLDRVYREAEVAANDGVDHAMRSLDRALEIGDRVRAWLDGGGLRNGR